MKKCPKCGNSEFLITPHVTQTWWMGTAIIWKLQRSAWKQRIFRMMMISGHAPEKVVIGLALEANAMKKMPEKSI